MDEEHHHRHEFSRLFIGLLGIMVGAIIVAAYQCITFGFCNQRQQQQNNQTVFEQNTTTTTTTTTNNSTVVIQVDMVFTYTKGCEKGTWAVCLSEFVEGEEIRVLPECRHSFHAPCVDMWLFSHSNCPLCLTATACLRSVVSTWSSFEGISQTENNRMPEFGV